MNHMGSSYVLDSLRQGSHTHTHTQQHGRRPGLTVFWRDGTAVCPLATRVTSRSNIEQGGSVHPGTLLLWILVMGSSEALRPHISTEHMPCYQPTEQHIMISPTINS